MVCVPCFIIPVLLIIWRRFIQPIVLRYWNPWAVKDEHGNVIEDKKPEFPFQCAGGKCPFPTKKGLASDEAHKTINDELTAQDVISDKSEVNKKDD